ncbi:MAG: hypothetical protein ACJ75B_11245 [Flavisolibacter sp.]
MKKLFILPLLVQFIFISQTFAQDSLEEKQVSYFKFSGEYLSDNVYNGRKDSTAIPYLTPTVGFYHKSGLFLVASASWLSTEHRLDEMTIQGGYGFSKNKLEGEFSVEKSFYSNSSYSVTSEMSGDVSAYLGYDMGAIKTSFTGTYTFGSATDYGLSVGLEHSFSLFQDRAGITPTFTANASTQNAYNSYYQKRKYAKSRKGKVVAYDITADLQNINDFKIMDYEASIPLSYSINQFTFECTPTLAMPVNPNQVVLTIKSSNGGSGKRTYTEHLGTASFVSLGISYKF